MTDAVAAGPTVPSAGTKLIIPFTGSSASRDTVPKTGIRAKPSEDWQPALAARSIVHASQLRAFPNMTRHSARTSPGCDWSRSEFTEYLASTAGRESLKGREIDAVADEPHRAVQQLEVSP